MEQLPLNGPLPSDCALVIVKENGAYKLGLKPVKPGALISILNPAGQVPKFEGPNPLTLTESGTNLRYTVNAGTAGIYRFQMGMPNVPADDQLGYPHSIYVMTGGRDEGTLRWDGAGLRVFETIQVACIGAVTFLKGYTAAEAFTDAVVLQQGGVNYLLPENQPSGVWTSPHLTGKWTAHFAAVAESKSREVIGDEDGDIEIVPDDGCT